VPDARSLGRCTIPSFRLDSAPRNGDYVSYTTVGDTEAIR
jgi:hypothetical protein